MTLQLKKSDFVNICRTCLLHKDKMLPIYTSHILYMLRLCTQVKIMVGDGLPCSICLDCSEEIYHSFNFKNLCEKSDRILHQILNEDNHQSIDENSTSLDIINKKSDIENSWTKCNEPVRNIDQRLKDVSTENNSEASKSDIDTYSEDFCVKKTLATRKVWKNMFKETRTKHKTILETKPTRCEVCNKIFETQRRLDRHLETHVNEKKYKCEECDKSFHEKSKLIRHKIVHRPKEQNIPCPLCDKTFSYEITLKEHRKRYHEGKLKRIVCTVCGKDFVDIKSHMRTHRSDPDIKPHRCEQCPKVFRNKAGLVKHIRVKHENNPPPANILCSKCGKRCYSAHELRNHMTMHTEERSFACHLCDKKYKLMSALNYHLRSHTGERPHVCEICTKAFYTSKILKSHMRIHTGERPFVCKLCLKTFAQDGALRNHMRIHRHDHINV